MNIPDYFSESLEPDFRVKNMVLKFFDADLGSGIFLTLDQDGKIRIRDKHPGSATLDPGCLFSGSWIPNPYFWELSANFWG
jgi:hypothetical protein